MSAHQQHQPVVPGLGLVDGAQDFVDHWRSLSAIRMNGTELSGTTNGR